MLLQLVAIDRRQLRLVSKVEDADLRIEVEDGRDFGVVEIEVDQQRSRPRGKHRRESDGGACCPIGTRGVDAESSHPAAPPAGIGCWMSPGRMVARTIPPWSEYQTTCGKSLVGIQSSADPCPT